MSTDSQALPQHLIERGWLVVSVKEPDPEGKPAVDGLVVLERLRASKAVRAIGRDLEHAISDAEDFDAREDAHPEFLRSSLGRLA